MEKKEAEKRINFKSGVPDLLYRQAAGRCSVPRCTNPTMGPYYESDGAVNMGVACHIFSAAENGPRGWGDNDEAFISSEKNGIWCCAYHATLIDKNNGKDYPVSMLMAWKSLAEARALKQMNDSPSPLGWVDSIEFTEFVSHLKLPKIQLSRYTLLWAKNETGKSSLMQIAASITDSRHAERFFSSTTNKPDSGLQPLRFSGQVTYSTVDALSKSIRLDIENGALVRREAAAMCLLSPGDLEVIYYCRESQRQLGNEDDLDFFMRVLDLDKSALLALANLSTGVLMPGQLQFSHADADSYEEDGDDVEHKRCKPDGQAYMELLFKRYPSEHFHPYAGLSESEQQRLLLDLFISKAREVAKQRLTLVMLDDAISVFDHGNFVFLLDALVKEAFQSLVLIPPSEEKASIDFNEAQPRLKDENHLVGWRLTTLPPPLAPV